MGWISFSCEGRCTSVPRPNKKRKTRKWLGFDVQAIFTIPPSVQKHCHLPLHKGGRNRLCFYNMCGSAHFIDSLGRLSIVRKYDALTGCRGRQPPYYYLISIICRKWFSRYSAKRVYILFPAQIMQLSFLYKLRIAPLSKHLVGSDCDCVR